MGTKHANRIGLAEQIKIADWLKANWESRVVKNAMSANECANTIANECGIAKLTDGNVRGVMQRLFPQWDFMHAATNPDIPGTANANIAGRLEAIEQQQAEWNKWLEKFGKAREGITDNLHQDFKNLYEEMRQWSECFDKKLGDIRENVIKQIQEQVKELAEAIVRMNSRLAHAEKEFGIKPMTSFLPPSGSKPVDNSAKNVSGYAGPTPHIKPR